MRRQRTPDVEAPIGHDQSLLHRLPAIWCHRAIGGRGRWAYSPAEPKSNAYLSKKTAPRLRRVRPQFAILGVAIGNKCC
jgi:hypothetical protein